MKGQKDGKNLEAMEININQINMRLSYTFSSLLQMIIRA